MAFDMKSLDGQFAARFRTPKWWKLVGKVVVLGVAACGLFAVATRTSAAAPYYLPTTGYFPSRYYFGAPNYYSYYYRPWYLSPFRYSYYAAKYGWMYPRYHKPYHPYPLGCWYGGYGPWCGFGAYADSGPVIVSAESTDEIVPPTVRFAGCDYW